jgi:hypothetical protein
MTPPAKLQTLNVIAVTRKATTLIVVLRSPVEAVEDAIPVVGEVVAVADEVVTISSGLLMMIYLHIRHTQLMLSLPQLPLSLRLLLRAIFLHPDILSLVLWSTIVSFR